MSLKYCIVRTVFLDQPNFFLISETQIILFKNNINFA